MIRFFLSWLLLLASALSVAAPLSLDFKEVKIVDFARLSFGGILRRSYVVDPDLLGDGRSISLSVRDLPASDLERFATDLLSGYGVRVETERGITYLRKVHTSSVAPLPALADSSQSVPGGLPVSVPAALPGSLRDASSLGSNALPLKHLPDLLDTAFEVYVPAHRDILSLQSLANSLLGVSYSSPAEVLLSGQPERVAKVLSLLKSLDRPRLQYVARAVLVEFNSDSTEGSAFQLALNILSGRLSLQTGAVLAGASQARIKGTSIDAVLSAVSSDSRFSFKSSPSLLISDGATARLQVGDKVPTRGDAVATTGGAVAQQTVYRDAGLILTLKPVAHADVVDLTVSQQVSNFQATTSSAIDSPTLSVRQLDTQLQLAPGDVVFLAGLDSDTDSDTRSGLSFLPRALDSRSKIRKGTQLVLALQLDVLK